MLGGAVLGQEYMARNKAVAQTPGAPIPASAAIFHYVMPVLHKQNCDTGGGKSGANNIVTNNFPFQLWSVGQNFFRRSDSKILSDIYLYLFWMLLENFYINKFVFCGRMPQGVKPGKSKAAAEPDGDNDKHEPVAKVTSSVETRATRGTKRRMQAEAEPASSTSTITSEQPSAKRHRAAARARKPLSFFPGQLSQDLFMFGTNGFGALGLGDPDVVDDAAASEKRTKIPRPKLPVLEEVKFVYVACGGMHTVALTADGDIYTWGANDEGALGRKTSGTFWENEPEDVKGDSFIPGQAHLPNGLKAVQVAAGDGFTFAVGTDGHLYGCGQFKDELGALSGFTPDVKIQGLLTLIWTPQTPRDRIKELKCGARHAVILTRRGDVLTWGCGSQGQLGRVKPYNQATEYQPTAAELFKPTEIAHLEALLGNTMVCNIACGGYNTFAIGENGAVVAWGLNNSGQLGIANDSIDNVIRWEPVAVNSLKGVTHIAGGEKHTLALTKGGILLSFGASVYGMLGRRDVDANANEVHVEPTPVDGLDGIKVEGIAAGTNVSACITADGDAWFWGSNTNLQLAKGPNDDDEPLPKRMGRVKDFGYRSVSFVCFGGQHAALLAGPKREVAPGGVAGPISSTGAAPSKAPPH
ncbi:hypothetical protein Vretifemale_6231 [Volvox reticuliferus]|uniref:RCC1-like domain-containing protein n=1 Tax=Volvox reticuliferus TaxID=1737510 RepID=A0A8J4FIL9_9CHLO|nr:hypothetical protein Vretifemale_6231 [Volvox reticuliferus]